MPRNKFSKPIQKRRRVGSRRITHPLFLVLLGFLVVLVILLAKPTVHLLSTISRDVDEREQLPHGFVDDASRLNKTKVYEVRRILLDTDDPEEQLAQLLAEARSTGRRVSIAGSRHSTGGHSIYPDGISIDMTSWNEMALEPEHEILSVQSGATWDEVIGYLDPLGRSVAIMQSNDSFTVGGSISVNCHGWQYNRPPIASSVLSFRLMNVDGEILRCSRTENPELFSLVLGGYGLFGIILEVELQTVANEAYRLEQHLIPAGNALQAFDEKIKNALGLAMVYARMNTAPDNFLNEIILNAFILEPEAKIPQRSGAEGNDLLSEMIRGSARTVFRGSEGSDYGKRVRWSAETRLAPILMGKVFSRNQLLDEGVETLENRSVQTTDVLHEYFVPPEQSSSFIDAVRRIIPAHDGDLLNVTIRQVNEDQDTLLRYADESMLCFVMLFLQDRNDEGERRMASMTRDLIDASLEHGGRYYLPYRLHATPEQFGRAYPQAEEFFERKRHYDPDELFQNQFYLKYGNARGSAK